MKLESWDFGDEAANSVVQQVNRQKSARNLVGVQIDREKREGIFSDPARGVENRATLGECDCRDFNFAGNNPRKTFKPCMHIYRLAMELGLTEAKDGGRTVRKYELKPTGRSPEPPPEWGEEWKGQPVSNRQLKFLRFFGIQIEPGITKGLANRLIMGIRANAGDRERWEKYKILTNDNTDESPDLKPFDRAELERLGLAEMIEEARAIKAEKSRIAEENSRAELRAYYDSMKEFMRDMGYSTEGLSGIEGARKICDLVLPIKYALEGGFTNGESLSREHRALFGSALSRWNHFPQLPSSGPIEGWEGMVDFGRDLTEEEGTGIMDIAFHALPGDVFLQLIPRTAEGHKQALDEILRKREA